MATFLPGPAGPLESLYRAPDGACRAGGPVAALVCHPHPARGGTMHNKVVVQLARGLEAAGLAVLRFNFRGVGMSAGRCAGGEDAEVDIAAALAWLAERHEGPLLLAGFSFGARHGLPVAMAHPRVGQVIVVGLPLKTPGVEAAGQKPVLFIHGEHDDLGPSEDIVALAQGWAAPAEVLILRGVGHFFERRVGELAGLVQSATSAPPGSGVRMI